jgi:hypothetical protein
MSSMSAYFVMIVGIIDIFSSIDVLMIVEYEHEGHNY